MIEDFKAANEAIADIYADVRNSLSTEQKQALTEIISSAIMPEKISTFVEFVYANKASFTDDQKSVTAQICRFATAYSFFGLGVDLRGNMISTILIGESVENPPIPSAKYVIA